MNPEPDVGHALCEEDSSMRSLDSVSTLAGFDDGIDEVFDHIDRTGDGEVSRIGKRGIHILEILLEE